MTQLSQKRSNKNLVSGNHIFRETPQGQLEFVGNFEALYQSECDPWSQSGSGQAIASYYAWSRQRLITKLKTLKPKSILEVGCGLGYVTQELETAFPTTKVVGMDISPTAVQKAQAQFPHSTFEQGDICSESFQAHRQYDVVILSQVLWYIIEAFPSTLNNCSELLNRGGHLVFTQAFLRSPQRYAKDLIDGFDGLVEYLNQSTIGSLRVVECDYDDTEAFQHHDGLVILQASGSHS